MKKARIFLSTLGFPTFVRRDIAILEQNYDVVVFHFRTVPKWLTPVSFLQQLWPLILNLRTTDVYICEFGAYHSLLPTLLAKLTGKPSLIIVAGTDCVSFPSIHYGNLRKRCLKQITLWSYELATHIAAVHKSLIFSAYHYYRGDYPQQGILAFNPKLKTPWTEIPYGYDDQFFYNIATAKIPNSFITVAVGTREPYRYVLKGIDLFITAARSFPSCSFTIVGDEQVAIDEVPKNVKVIGKVDPEQLRQLFSEHEFYLQLSISEGFPNAPCEAMLCECIPIGSRVGALPDIIGDTGFILEERSVEQLRDLIQKAVNCDKARLAKAARQRIIDHFPLKRREESLLSLLERLLQDRLSG